MTNNSLQDYLKYYLKLDSPGYAVLVTGEWGSGKTYQTLRLIPEDIQCHVSLFGISNANDIYTNVFSKMYPGKSFAKKAAGLAKDATSEIQGVTFGAGAILGNIFDAMIKESVDQSKIIIFDDLERCSLGNEEILGAINKYVEHHKCRVIVLAHDEKAQKEFSESKEKIIGHTIKITPQIDEAGEVFFRNSARIDRFSTVKPLIIDAFKRTNCQSLRVLRHVIKDCDRLLKCLEPKYIRNFKAMQLLFTNFTIVNTEYRQGNITAQEIPNIKTEYYDYTYNKINSSSIELSESKKRVLTFLQKYSEQDILCNLIDYDLLSKIMECGNYPKEIIKDSLDLTEYFMDIKESPAWLKILNFVHLSDETVNEAISTIFTQLKSKAITDIGEMLHTFHVLFLLSQKQAINEDYISLEHLLTTYIDELFNLGLLIPSPLNEPISDDIYQNSHGRTYILHEDYKKHTNTLIEYLKKKRNEALKAQYSKFGDEILDALEHDISKFIKIFLGNSEEVGLFSRVDILSTILVDDFVIRWFLLPRKDWEKVRMVLNSRYKDQSNQCLKNEKDWIFQLCITLKIEARSLKGLEKFRVECLIPYGAIRAL
ncbi:TPA: hypothetical protein ACSTLU_004454 [Serratia fonticola]